MKYGVFFIAVPAATLCVWLGFWQISRLHQRQAWNDGVRAALAQPPLDLTAASGDLPAFRPVSATGKFDYDRQVAIEDFGPEGSPVLVVLTPLRLSDSSAVMVERGWAPSPDPRRGKVSFDSLREGDSSTVLGVVIGRKDPRFVATAYPYRLRPFVVRRTSKGPLRPVPLPELTDGPHVSYAIQWFSFAVIVLVGAVFLYRKEDASRKAHVSY